MTTDRDDVDIHLSALAAATRAAAPRPAPPAVIRILAERRRVASRARRLEWLVAAACAAPVVTVLLARGIGPGNAPGALAVVACLALAVLPALGAATCAWRWRI